MSSSPTDPTAVRVLNAPQLFPRHIAVAILAAVACFFAANHVAARLTFENGTGLLLAVLCRSAVALSILIAIVYFKRHSIRLPRGLVRWQLVLGLMITIQSLCLYSAVARVPVALALLTANTFPIILALLTWGLGGPRPTLRAAGLMLFILSGLVLALDLPGILGGGAEVTSSWWMGIGFALMAATVLSVAFWVTDHKLAGISGPVRSMFTMLVVFVSMIIAGIGDVVPGGMGLPNAMPGWMGLMALMLLYGGAFAVLFINVPRLDMARNAPVMNMEPIATLLFGWVILGQMISPIQMLGGLVVVSGIVILTLRKGA
ncbi:MAG: EamA family transporter [Thalassospira sp.]|uniref:EamA family transporter n=1 Tax=Thalassospira sp. UBA4513 TaxID=1947675 RepID=UPI000C54B7BF|nr:DMT family transporter [Thalassospira sp. UBA4513]MBE69304.1 EamA family transporter [Thalassospira sp.]|tara:strand:- start:97 stop:1047 length:951 start_codon:yes stop_codon:yes gene_type:complete